MLETLTKDDWTRHQGEPFLIESAPGNSILLNLIGVTGYGKPMGGNREAYSLMFLGPMAPILPQKIYHARNEGMGEMEIFLVPVGPHAEGMQYEAVFT
jgi:hypothetical protein